MGIRAISLSKWRNFLKSQGLILIRRNGGHEMWNLPDESLKRSITFQSHKDMVPRTIIHTNLQTLCITHEEFEKITKDKKMSHVDSIRTTEEKETSFVISYEDQKSVIRCIELKSPNKQHASDCFYKMFNYKYHVISIDQV